MDMIDEKEINKIYSSFITKNEIDKIIKEQRGLIHPIVYLLSDVCDSSNNFNFIKYNTSKAIKYLKLHEIEWLESKKK